MNVRRVFDPFLGPINVLGHKYPCTAQMFEEGTDISHGYSFNI